MKAAVNTIEAVTMKYPNIYALFRERCSQYAERDAFYARRNGQWSGISWRHFSHDAHDFGCALIALGLTKGRSVCILMGNVPEWPVADVGSIIAGAVSVGLYPTSSAEQCRYIIEHSDAQFVLVDTQQQLNKILSVREHLTNLKAIVVLDGTCAQKYQDVISYRDFLKLGCDNRESCLPVVTAHAEQAGADDTAIMVYTSGTTGLPKGACLSHRYVLNSVESLLKTIPISEQDRSFSYLPYCHVAERISGLYNRLYAGAAAYFVDDLNRLWDYMQEVKPTVFGSLPRFFEKIHARICSDLESAPEELKSSFNRALVLGREIGRLRQQGQSVPPALQNEYESVLPAARERMKSYFGGAIRIATSGGAPLPIEIAEYFDALGLPILQAYGLTENVCVAFNRPDNHRFGTVGQPMPGCQVKLAEDGEILVSSEMMFSGYYKEPEKTAEIMRDGWLYTGDLGTMTPDGFLKITGRKKELIITSTGKNIAPALIENLIKEHHLISHALAYGDGKSYIVALITLNQWETESYARARGINYKSFSELTGKAEIVAMVEQIVAAANRKLSSTEAVKRFVILDHDLSVEADEVTPTMKIKRKVVTERYREQLEQLYR